MVVTLVPDAEVLAVAWAKADLDLQPLLGGVGKVRVATKLPHELILPFLRVVWVPGSTEHWEQPLAAQLLQWDAYAKKNDYAAASDLIRTVIAKAKLFSGPIGGGWIYSMMPLSGPERVEEPETEWARFRCDMEIVVRP
jgi:hypothetical protein